MTQLLRWTRRLLATLAVLLLMTWMWAWGAQWVLRWRAERLLTDVRTLEVGRTTGADVERLARSRPEWERSECQSGKCIFYSAHVFVRGPYWIAGRLLNFFFPNDDRLQTKFEGMMGHLGLRAMFADGYLVVERESLTERSFTVMLPLPRDPHGIMSLETAQFKDDSTPRDGRHPVLRWMRGSAKGILVEYQPTEDPAVQAAMMDFHLSCLTRFLPCQDDADILPGARQLIDDDVKRTGGLH